MIFNYSNMWHYTINTQLNRIEVTADSGKVIAFIEYRDFGSHYPYFSFLLDNQSF